jgi:16S rRNA (guanine966-N2)-methyltransferase
MRARRATVTVGSGRWRGRVLAYPDDPAIRPSMHRTKHSMFSSLGERLQGAVFADLFAGAGAVGIEALSLGASRVHFVEGRPRAVAALRANLAALGADPASYEVHEGTVAAVLARRPCPVAGAAIVFADPPYGADPEAEMWRHFRAAEFAALEFVVVEHRTRVAVAAPEGLALERERRFGDTTLTYFVPVR